MGVPFFFLRRMHTSNFGLYQLLSIPSVCQTLFHECASTRLEVRNLPHYQQTKAHITQWRHTWEDGSQLSVECTTPTLVPISSSPSPLFAKLCSMSVHQYVQ